MSLATSAVAALLPVADIDRAKGFYDRLDLPFLGTNDEGSLMYQLSGGDADPAPARGRDAELRAPR